MSIRPSTRNNLGSAGHILMKFDIETFLKICREKVPLKFNKNNGSLHEDDFTFMTISHSFLLRMRNVSNKNCRENQNTHFMFSNFFFH
jgi:hypothetical protein